MGNKNGGPQAVGVRREETVEGGCKDLVFLSVDILKVISCDQINTDS